MTHRRRPPDRRYSESVDFVFGDNERIIYTATVGYHHDGAPAELFLTCNKAGSGADAVARDAAYVFSLAVQYGCPIDVIRSGLLRGNGDAKAGVLGCALDELDAAGGLAPRVAWVVSAGEPT